MLVIEEDLCLFGFGHALDSVKGLQSSFLAKVEKKKKKRRKSNGTEENTLMLVESGGNAKTE